MPATQAAQAMQQAMNTTSSGGGARVAAARKGGSALSTSAASTLWRNVQSATNDAEGAVLALQQGDRGLARDAAYRVANISGTTVSLGSTSIDVGPALQPSLDRLRGQIGKLSQEEQLDAWKALDQLFAGVHESTNEWAYSQSPNSLPAAGVQIVKRRIWLLEHMQKLGDAALEYAPMRVLAAMRESASKATPMQSVP